MCKATGEQALAPRGRVSLLSSLLLLIVFLSLRRKNTDSMKVSNTGNVVDKAMLKGTNAADRNMLKTPIIDP